MSEPFDADVETVIFVDVDGVLNVGVRDHGDAPLLFNDSNRDFALGQRGRRQASKQDEECVTKLQSVATQCPPAHQEGSSYSDLACGKGSHVSEVLAQRLAEIVHAAGPRRSVVLSSNWRKPQHAARVKKLEAEVSRQMGAEFMFDARTRPAEERSAADRLRCIGDYVESLFDCNGRFHDGRPLRLLVLEDFFITPLDGWACGTFKVDSCAAAEAYLLNRAPPSANVAAKLVHTYHEWCTPSGLRVQVGGGLTDSFFQEAVDFIGTPIRFKQQQQQQLETNGITEAKLPKALPPLDKACGQGIAQGTQGLSAALVEPRWVDCIKATWPMLSMYRSSKVRPSLTQFPLFLPELSDRAHHL
jgi:hypothetical protein